MKKELSGDGRKNWAGRWDFECKGLCIRFACMHCFSFETLEISSMPASFHHQTSRIFSPTLALGLKALRCNTD